VSCRSPSGFADSDPPAGGVKLVRSEGSMVGFPLGYCHEAFPKLKGVPCRRGHPS
jgi:hypothetical protein